MKNKLTMLMILDGFGENSNDKANAVKMASTPNLDKFIYQTATDEDIKNFEENTENSEISEVACGAINDKNGEITKDIVAKDNLGDDNTIN